MSRRLLILGLGLAAVGLAVATARGITRDVLVVPLLGLIWDIVQLFESLPQLLVWWVLVLAALMMVGRSVSGSSRLRLPERPAPDRGGRVAEWARLAAFARTESYSRWRLAQRLALLAQDLIAHREGVDLRQARRLIEEGAQFSPDVRAYLLAGLAAHRPPGGLIGRLRRGRAADPLTLDPERVVAALEQFGEQP